jgi:hypothetical protein
MCKPSCIVSAGVAKWRSRTTKRLEVGERGAVSVGLRRARGLILLCHPAPAEAASDTGGCSGFSDAEVIRTCAVRTARSSCRAQFRDDGPLQSADERLSSARLERSQRNEALFLSFRETASAGRLGRRGAWLPISRVSVIARMTRSCGTGLY